MKRIVFVLMVLMLCLSWLSCAPGEKEAPKKELKSPSEKLSYALGLDIGASLKRLETDIDLPSLVAGVQDTLDGREPLLTPQQVAEVKEEFFKKMREEGAQKARDLVEKNRKEGEAFLAENKEKEGVVTTASGLQYVVLTEGEGPRPKATDQVHVHYRGMLLDGTEFDSSYKRGQPVTFPVTGVIAGWTEALQLMRVGAKYRLFIPSNLGYGERGAGQRIGPNATLIFEVELLGIEQ